METKIISNTDSYQNKITETSAEICLQYEYSRSRIIIQYPILYATLFLSHCNYCIYCTVSWNTDYSTVLVNLRNRLFLNKHKDKPSVRANKQEMILIVNMEPYYCTMNSTDTRYNLNSETDPGFSMIQYDVFNLK